MVRVAEKKREIAGGSYLAAKEEKKRQFDGSHAARKEKKRPCGCQERKKEEGAVDGRRRHSFSIFSISEKK